MKDTLGSLPVLIKFTGSFWSLSSVNDSQCRLQRQTKTKRKDNTQTIRKNTHTTLCIFPVCSYTRGGRGIALLGGHPAAPQAAVREEMRPPAGLEVARPSRGGAGRSRTGRHGRGRSAPAPSPVAGPAPGHHAPPPRGEGVRPPALTHLEQDGGRQLVNVRRRQRLSAAVSRVLQRLLAAPLLLLPLLLRRGGRRLRVGLPPAAAVPVCTPGRRAPTARRAAVGGGQRAGLRIPRTLASGGLGLRRGGGGGRAAGLLAGRAGRQAGPLALAHHLGGDLAGRPGRPQEAPHRRGQQAREEEALAAAPRLPGGGRQAEEAAGGALLRCGESRVRRRWQQGVPGG